MRLTLNSPSACTYDCHAPRSPSLDALALAGPETGESKTDPMPAQGQNSIDTRPVAGDPASSGVGPSVARRPQVAAAPPELAGTDVRSLCAPSDRRSPRPPSALSRSRWGLSLARGRPRTVFPAPRDPRAIGGRPLQDVPEVYRSRLDPNRSSLAKRAGATAASEQAVERALAWLSRHQDADGRWDAGVALCGRNAR